ncbi:MAG TPA: TRAP transporter large permease subunit [Dehalococcoidales bacterium]|nr:TRAP transporter large permease subunit [Dehalococcoidales bacterium]
MIDLSPEMVTIIMIGGIFASVLTGFPLGFLVGALALFVGLFVFGGPIPVANVIYNNIFGIITNYVIIAVPLFVFMGVMLERSGIAERMYDALYLWLGGLRGGLAIVTVLMGTIIAATVGIIAASITMLALAVLPSMVKRGYSKSLASGAVTAGGCLGILIPPSIMLVLYGPMAGISVGQLFFGAFLPGFTLSALYILYIAIRSYLQPSIAPAVPVEDRKVPFARKTWLLVTSIVPVAILIFSVLGVIFLGIAPPTEAAGVGAFIATLLAIAYRRFSLTTLKEASLITLRACGFIFVIVTMAVAFSAVFLGGGGRDVMSDIILAAPGGRWGIFAVIMFIIFLMGMFIEWIAIVYIMVPIITPIAQEAGFSILWFSIMVCVNLQMAFMTPPFASGIFICRGACDPKLGITMGDIIKGVLPHVGLIIIGLVIFTLFPQIITWLPSQMIR